LPSLNYYYHAIIHIIIIINITTNSASQLPSYYSTGQGLVPVGSQVPGMTSMPMTSNNGNNNMTSGYYVDNSSMMQSYNPNQQIQYHQSQVPTVNMQTNQPQQYSQQQAANRQRLMQPWHTTTPDLDSIRDSVRQAIINLLISKRPNATPEVLQQVPRSAVKLEDALFVRARSVEDFQDMSTLKERIQRLASEMHKNKNPQTALQQQQQQHYQQQLQNPQLFYQQQNQNNLDSANGPYNADKMMMMNNAPSLSASALGGPTSSSQGDGRQFVQMSQINPLMAGSTTSNVKSAGPPQTTSLGLPPTGPDGQHPAQNEADYRKQVLRQQQQRLLLLRHASKCPHEKCPVTSHCESMKRLWRHIMSCKEAECKVAHCVSSRYVLSHYSKCREAGCPVCGPVREAIKRNSERGRAIVQMSQQSGIIMPGELKKAHDSSKPKAIKPLDPVSCSMYSFTDAQVQAHYNSIHEGMKNNNNRIRDICFPPLDEILKLPDVFSIFGHPVDPVALNLSDYFQIVKNPMDLGTIKKKLDQNVYRDNNAFIDDVNLCFDNAILYNPVGTVVYSFAKKLKASFANKFKASLARYEDR